MSIATELTHYNNGLLDAYTAVNTKGGTVPANKNLDNLPTAITSIPSGGGGVTRPATWAEFKAMTATEQKACYGIGDRVGIACSWKSTSSGTDWPDLLWQIAGWGTTKKENDNTDYPCVTLVTQLQTDAKYAFDAAETAVTATEETAEAGIYYFGFDGTNYIALNLSTGDPIPYGTYTAVYKTDVTNNASYYNDIRTKGYNVYKYSNIRQWLNSDGTANNWWHASHVGDVAPAYANQAGFMNGLGSAFKAILDATKTDTAGNHATDDGGLYSTYDYIFLPSAYETYLHVTPVEGEHMDCFAVGEFAKAGLRAKGPLGGGNTEAWWTRSAYEDSAYASYDVSNRGARANSNASTANEIIVACKIILAGA